jgi:hypothetical protein
LVVGSNPTGPTTPNMAPDLKKRVTGILAVAVCALAIGYFLLKTARTSNAGAPLSAEKPAEQVSVSIRNALKAPSRESGSGFWIAYDGPLGETLSPSNLAINVRAVNNTRNPVKIARYSAQIDVGEGWIELARIPFGHAHTPYFGFSSEALQPVLTSDPQTDSVSLDVNSQAAIPPKAELVGWALFEYPDHVKNTQDAAVRVTLSTDSGAAFTAEASKIELAGMGGVPEDVGGRIDLSRLHVGWYSKMANRPK